MPGQIMAYRRTEKVEQRLRQRHAMLIAAARAIAAEHGLDAVQIVPVAERAGVAAGTVYRYFAAKKALVEALAADVSLYELAAIRAAAAAAPGPLSALAATLVTFGARAGRQRRLMWAMLAEPADAELALVQRRFRADIASEVATRIAAALEGGAPADVDPALLAPAIVGGLVEALLGPLASAAHPDTPPGRTTVQSLALAALRACGIVDARARGLIVQAAWPAADAGGANAR